MNQNVYLVSVADEGKRLDQFLKERTGLTRSEVQKWIKAQNQTLHAFLLCSPLLCRESPSHQLR